MRLRILLLAAAVAVTPPALAHRMWLLPSTTTLATVGQYVTVDAAISNDLFYPDHFPMPLERVKAWAPDGSPAQIENGATGRYRSTFDVKIDRPGTWKIGTESESASGTFKLNGEDWRVGGRRGPPPGAAGAPRPAPKPAAGATPGRPRFDPAHSVATPADIPAGATDLRLTQVLSRNFTFVTAGEPTQTVFGPTNHGLELQPLTHPASLVSDEPGRFRFLVDGRPAAGVKVTVVPGNKRFRETEGAQELTTDAQGVLTVRWPVAGVYWMSASVTDDHPSLARATERRMSYTTTVEVPAP